MPDLTTTEAAALLTALGVTDNGGGPVRRALVTQWCQRGHFVSAWHDLSERRGAWHIPRESVERFATAERRQGKKRGSD